MAEEELQVPIEESEEDEHECDPGIPAWIVSYGDMMTLLLCFFILYFQMDVQNGMRDVVEKNSIMEEIEQKTISDRRIKETASELLIIKNAVESSSVQGEKKPKKPEVKKIKLLTVLGKEMKDSKVKVVEEPDLIEITLPAASYFSRGKAELYPDKLEIFTKLVGALQQKQKSKVATPTAAKLFIEVEGHTDNIPIRGWLSRYFPSNWELSSARASSVVRVLKAQGLEGDFRVIGLAETQPLGQNNSEINRALNRRVVIRIKSEKSKTKVKPTPQPE